jgi:uncharacterized protein YfaS (alpha-2-macroglobulin family)
LTVFSCKKSGEIDSKDSVAESALVEKTAEGDGFSYANDEAIKLAFTLDYRAETPEPEQAAETLDEALRAAGAAARSAGVFEIIPGLRKLSDYKTDYTVNNTPAANESPSTNSAAPSAPNLTPPRNAGALTVVDWGPQKFLSSAVKRPSVFVIFSQPMVPLAALGAASDSSPIVSIEPPLKGTFRWYGTSFISFESDGPCQEQQTYTITVAPSAQSLYGKKIEGQTSFSFETERLSMKAIEPGREFRKENNFYFSDNDVPPLAAKQITIIFNGPVQEDGIKNYIVVASDSGGEKRFDLTQLDENTLLASLLDDIEFDTRVTVTLKQGAHSGNGTLGSTADQVFSFRTPPPFTLTDMETLPAWGKYRNVFSIDFSVRIDADSALGALRTEPAMPLTKENTEVWGSTIRISNLPVGFNEKFKIIVDTDLRDVYGRHLGKSYERALTSRPEPPPIGSVNFLDWGNSMLEAQFEPRFLFEYKNIADSSFYRLEQKNNPYSNEAPKTTTVKLQGFEKNYTYFEEMDLRPYLNGAGKGFVSFYADINLLERGVDTSTGKQKTYNVENELNLQVTDLGLTVRYAFNKTVVLVTSLSTGAVVEGAVVRLIAPDLIASNADISGVNSFAEAITNKDGLAVLNTAAGVFRNAALRSDRAWNHTPYVFAEKDGDRAVFSPSYNSVWRFGIEYSSTMYAERAQPVTFMFSDRGIYKPGETITFRGVDRSLLLGMYTIYNGDYTVNLVKDAYKGETAATLSGTTSESGGYYGGIKLSEDLTPGEYRLKYVRNNYADGNEKDAVCADIPITVAYFERLKFQASISAPPVETISGEDINVTLQASYLSGGNLSGAAWRSAWFSELTYFNPALGQDGFVFGPRNVYEGKKNISSAGGVLSADGKAALSQKTSNASVAGAAYTYSVEASVTDLSNQQISASRSVMVHPALFYIGAAMQLRRGFAKAGEEISVNYITVDTSGKTLTNDAQFLNRGEGAKIISAELIRETWTRAQMRGVNNYVYDNYERSEIIDSTEKINIKTSGTIKVKPSKAGFYILRLTSFDREGRKALTEITFYATGSNFSYWNMNNPGDLKLVPDKAVYNPGDTAEILLQSSLPAGRYLITVEREGIFTEEVRVFDEPVSVINIPIARNYVPVVYVAVSSYSTRSGPPKHSYGTPDLDKPEGRFGAVKLFVNPRVRAFSVKVESGKKVFRPGDEVTLTLTAEKDGAPMPNAELSLMAVDRGVLDLINYHVPDPIAYFYNEDRFPIRVGGDDSRTMLMDPVTYSIKNLSGGDADDGDKIEERKDFNPMAVFEPFLLTDEKGKVTCTFKLPDTLTTYRITVFGVRGDLFSLKETEIAARNVINVQQVQPRRLRERDTAEAGVLITNLDSVPHKISVSLGIGEISGQDDDSGVIKQKGAAFVDGGAEHTVTVAGNGNAVVYFDVAAEKQGEINLVYTIKSDVLNERLTQNLIIEKPYIKETVVTSNSLAENSVTEAVVIPGFADDGNGSLTITLDATRLSLLESAVNYLFHYPYGCMEQRSAAVMPLVIFGEYIDALNLQTEVSDPKKVVQKEISSWSKIQRPDGGFPYWPSGLYSNIYVSLRIAHTIVLAKEKNISVPDSFDMDKLYNYLEDEYQKLYRESLRLRGMDTSRAAQNAYISKNNVYLRSYMLYVFSLLKKNNHTSHITEIIAANKDDPIALAFAGMAARAVSRNDIASDAGRTLRNLLRPTARGVDLSDGNSGSSFLTEYYGDKNEQLALTLQFFIDQYPGDDINTRLLYSLLMNKSAGAYWSNTAVTIRVLSAVDRLIQTENLTKTNVTGVVTLDGRELLNAGFKGLGAKAVSKDFSFKDFPLAALPRDSSLPLVITRRGTGNIYWTAALSYALPAEMQGRRDEGIGVFQTVRDFESGEILTGAQLESGRLYQVELRVSSSRDRNYLALRVPIPSGAEILDARFNTTASAAALEAIAPSDDKSASPDLYQGKAGYELSNQAIFDNEVQYFWDTFSKGETTARFLIRAARRGVYPTPPVQAECMYENEIFGRSEGILFTIK